MVCIKDAWLMFNGCRILMRTRRACHLGVDDGHRIADEVEQGVRNALPHAEVLVDQELAGIDGERLDDRIVRSSCAATLLIEGHIDPQRTSIPNRQRHRPRIHN
jgi:hypothetical protein